MGKQTSAAIFVSIREMDKFSAAAIPQHVQRAIAEQAIKIFRVGALMTGEIFAFPIAEISVVLILPILLTHENAPYKMRIVLYMGTARKSVPKRTRPTKHSFLRLKSVLPVPAEAPYVPTYLTYLSYHYNSKAQPCHEQF